MSKKKLTIKGITFPQFGDDDSKKNFRLVFYIGYTDADGEEMATIVSKPDSGHWQWRKSKKDFFLPVKAESGDSVELNTTFLKAGGNGFEAKSDQIAEIDGDITDITVQFIDVFDESFGNFMKNKLLPEVIKQLKGLGINPIDLLPVPGVITTVLKDKIKVDELATKLEGVLTDDDGDKLLHTISAEYKGEKTLTLKEEKVWNKKKQKKGIYGVTIGIK